MTEEEAKKEIENVFVPEYANYIITALTEGATISDKALEQEPTANAIPIPDNTTNGDMIMAMFPNISIYEHGSTYSVNNEYNFNSNWWNAPYKKEVEE